MNDMEKEILKEALHQATEERWDALLEMKMLRIDPPLADRQRWPRLVKLSQKLHESVTDRLVAELQACENMLKKLERATVMPDDDRGFWEELHPATGPLKRCPRCAANGGVGELIEQDCASGGSTIACEGCGCCLGDDKLCSSCEHRHGGER